MTDKQQQAAFEAHALDRGLSLARINSIDDIYDSDQTAEAWEAWTASRKLALEEAAQIAERQSAIYDQKIDAAMKAGNAERWDLFDNYKDAADYIAAAIRQEQEEGARTPQHPLQVAPALQPGERP